MNPADKRKQTIKNRVYDELIREIIVSDEEEHFDGSKITLPKILVEKVIGRYVNRKEIIYIYGRRVKLT